MAGHDEWHGSFPIACDRVARFVLGPLQLWIHRHPRDWTFSWRRSDDPLSSVVEVEHGAAPPPADDDLEVARHLCGTTLDTLALGARLADRTVVSRPEVPVIVQAGQDVSLWISTPLWIRVAEMPDDHALAELPVVRMSDTWVGPDTRSGELCYATRTRARTSDFVEPHPVRAVTRVEVHNRDDSPLSVERINVPVPHLALYRASRMWLTSELRVVRERDSRALAVEVVVDPPDASTLVAAPRESSGGPGLLRGIQALLQ